MYLCEQKKQGAMQKGIEERKLKETRDLLDSYGYECYDFNEFFESLGIECIEIIPPINSTVYCLKRADKQWGAFVLGNKTPIVDFGKYIHMWGYDNGYCLVSVYDEDRTTFANRGIIDSCGKEVVKPYTYNSIWNFYGKEEPQIIAHTENGNVGLDKNNPSVIINRNPFGRRYYY